MSEEDASAATTDNGTDDTHDASSDTSRGRGRGRGGGRGGRGSRGGRGRGRGRGGFNEEGDSSEQPADESADAESGAVDESGEGTDGRGRGRGRGGRGRGRGGVPRSQRPLREVPAPDEEAWTAAKQKHASVIADINKQIDSYTTKIDTSNKQRKAHRDQLKQLTTHLAATTTAKAALFEQYNKMTQHIDSIEHTAREHKKAVEQLKRDITPYTSLLDIDTAIKGEEKKLNAGGRALGLAEERSVVDEVRRLRGLRPKVVEYEKKGREVGAGPGKGDVEAHVSDREEVRRQAYEKKEEEEKERQKVEEEQKKEKKLTSEIDDWIAQRRELINKRQQEDREWAVREDEYAKNRSAYDSYAKEKEWRDNEESRRAQEKAEYEERQRRRERRDAERAQREEDDKQWREEREREESERDPYEKEKYTVVELIKYVEKLSVKDKDDDEEPTVDEKQQQLLNERISAFGGKQAKPIVPAKKKKDSLYESLVTQPKEKKVKPKKQTRVLTHVPDVFALFKVVGVEPPLLSSDVDGALEKLREREQFYENAPVGGGGGRGRGRGRGRGGGDGRGRGRGGRGGGASGGGDDGGVEYEHEGGEEENEEVQVFETGDAATEEQPAEEVEAAE